MQPRIEYAKAAPGAMTAMLGLETYVLHCGLERSLLELVKVRASQINGCAYCVDMHTKDARAEGESEQRLYAVIVWEETPFFTERERAALAWTEAVTLIGQGHVPNDVYQQARGSFSEAELVNLTLAIIVINGWNRLAISFRTVPGTYQPARENSVKIGAHGSPAQKEEGHAADD
jgi:AhpD family alkylhydroperoxidase